MDVPPRAGILRYFAELKDPRMERTREHELPDILAIAICAIICGADGWVQVEQFGNCKLKWFRTFLHLPNGIPSHDTFGRVFARLAPDAFERCFGRWVESLAPRGQRPLVAIDGKTLRHSFGRAAGVAAIHMVSAYCQDNQTILGQVACEAKTNEITALPKLLELLDLAGAIVTADALHCQTATARDIVDAKGDYILQVKDNQPQLHEDLKLLFDNGPGDDCRPVPYDFAEDVDAGHGRVETRRCWVASETAWLADRWPGIGSVACVERVRDTGEESSTTRHYYISSLKTPEAAEMLGWIRGHWSVENSLHWILDVQFREDDRCIRTGHAAENFSRLSRIALNLLKADKTKKVGIKTKRLCGGWDHNYLLHLFTQEH